MAKGNNQLISVILHNLAVMNYCEVTEHNEIVMNGDAMDEVEKLE